MSWGMELLLDCQGCDLAVARDRKALAAYVRELVAAIDMRPFGEPRIEHFATHDPDKAGYSLVQFIETSSIVAHFVDRSGDAYIDIFSCKPFDDRVAIEVTQRSFRPRAIKALFVERDATAKSFEVATTPSVP